MTNIGRAGVFSLCGAYKSSRRPRIVSPNGAILLLLLRCGVDTDARLMDQRKPRTPNAMRRICHDCERKWKTKSAAELVARYETKHISSTACANYSLCTPKDVFTSTIPPRYDLVRVHYVCSPQNICDVFPASLVYRTYWNTMIMKNKEKKKLKERGSVRPLLFLNGPNYNGGLDTCLEFRTIFFYDFNSWLILCRRLIFVETNS